MRKFLIFFALIPLSASHAASMGPQDYERVKYAICKDNTNAKLCSDLVNNLMFQVKANSEIKMLCDQVDEKGGNTSGRLECSEARKVDAYIVSKN